jgi:hypothetical protein
MVRWDAGFGDYELIGISNRRMARVFDLDGILSLGGFKQVGSPPDVKIQLGFDFLPVTWCPGFRSTKSQENKGDLFGHPEKTVHV